MDKNISSILKKSRINAGMSVEEVSSVLIQKGYKALEKTIYSWETGNSQPKPDVLLELCSLYGISDVLGTFGYSRQTGGAQTIAAHKEEGNFTPEELNKIEEYKRLLLAARPKSNGDD